MNYTEEQALLLLCAPVGLDPLTGAQLAHCQGGALAPLSCREILENPQVLGEKLSGRVQKRAEKAAEIFEKLQRLEEQGIFPLTLLHPLYPAKLLQVMQNPPPVFFAKGRQSLLMMEGIAAVGSREADREGLTFARQLAAACGEEGLCIISGGARGIDQAALKDGAGIAVLPCMGDFLRKEKEKVESGRLLALCPFDPEGVFASYKAHERNKLIYALSQAAVVIQCNEPKGGTWSGAMHCLDARYAPLYVCMRQTPAHLELIRRGGRPLWPQEVLNLGVRRTLLKLE